MTHQPDKPVAGLYKMRLVSKGPWVAVKIAHGSTADPADPDNAQDRPERWQAWINGEEQKDVWAAWPSCAGKPITQYEYDFILALAAYVKKYEPDMPEASPRKKIDLNTVPPVYKGKT